METSQTENSLWKRFLHRYFIEGLNGMALGLFCSLIVGLIIKQIGSAIGGDVGGFIVNIGTIASVCMGAAIGVGSAHSLNAPKLIIFSSAITGFFGAQAATLMKGSLIVDGVLHLSGGGDPLSAFLAAVIGLEIGRLVSGKTKIDIIVTPIVTIVSGCAVGAFIGPPISEWMTWLGQVIMLATELQPFLMGIAVSVIMGIILTLPISSAALSIILGLSGLAAGAATIGCCCQMVGFAVASFRENKWDGLLAQGLGTSMLQMPNIVRNPRIWLPSIISSAILGPLATKVFFMSNNPAGGGMGSSGLVGQLMTWQTMAGTISSGDLLFRIILLHFILPAAVTLVISELMRKKGWIKPGDMKLSI
ncbi:MAG: PTS sugar transporter subunit IIC [Firmicutes bacterium]|nr:PTS sugar transporter subunit IIC [Bacillota bacterium]